MKEKKQFANCCFWFLEKEKIIDWSFFFFVERTIILEAVILGFLFGFLTDRYQPNNQPPPAGPVDAVAANHRGPNYFHVQPPSAYVPLEVSADQVPNTRQNPYTGGGEMQLEPQPYYPEGAGPPPYQGAPPPPPAQDVNPYSFSGYGPPPQPVAQPVYQPQPSWQQSYPQPGPFYAPQGSFGGGQPTPYGNGYGPSPPVYPFYPPPSPQGP